MKAFVFCHNVKEMSDIWLENQTQGRQNWGGGGWAAIPFAFCWGGKEGKIKCPLSATWFQGALN